MSSVAAEAASAVDGPAASLLSARQQAMLNKDHVDATDLTMHALYNCTPPYGFWSISKRVIVLVICHTSWYRFSNTNACSSSTADYTACTTFGKLLFFTITKRATLFMVSVFTWLQSKLVLHDSGDAYTLPSCLCQQMVDASSADQTRTYIKSTCLMTTPVRNSLHGWSNVGTICWCRAQSRMQQGGITEYGWLWHFRCTLRRHFMLRLPHCMSAVADYSSSIKSVLLWTLTHQGLSQRWESVCYMT